MSRVLIRSNGEKQSLGSELEKHCADVKKDLRFGLNEEWNSGQGAVGNKSWVIRVWDTGWHNELKTIKLNLTWMNFQFWDGRAKILFLPFFLKTTPNS